MSYEPSKSMQKLVARVEALKDKMYDQGVRDCVRAIKKMEALCEEGETITYYSGFYAAYMKFKKGITYTDATGETVTLVELKSYDNELLAGIKDRRLQRLIRLAQPIFDLDMWLSDDQSAPELGGINRDGAL